VRWRLIIGSECPHQFPVDQVGAVAVTKGPVQLRSQLGGLLLVQVAGQHEEPEGLVVVNLLVGDHRRPPCPSANADRTVAEAHRVRNGEHGIPR
jgi:hypothetical protein